MKRSRSISRARCRRHRSLRRGNAEAAEAAGIDEAQFPARGELQMACVCLRISIVRIADLQSSGHAEVDDQVGVWGGHSVRLRGQR